MLIIFYKTIKIQAVQIQRIMIDTVLKDKLIQLTGKCDELSKNGKYVECIDLMEEIVSIKKNVYGLEHTEFEKSSEKLCQYLNLAAMICLQKEKFQQSLDYLRKAQLLARNSLHYKSTTYNNLACYYRRTGKIRTALTYLIQALDMQLKLDQPKTLPDTHLNLCAVLSQLDRHQDALQHVMLSIILLQDQFLQSALPKMQQSQNAINEERLAVLAIAYHNLGVQFEYLKRFQEAVKIYKKALNISIDHLSDNEQLINNLTKVVDSATEQIKGEKKSVLQSRKQKFDRQTSETKKDFYKDLSRQVDKLKFPGFGLKDNSLAQPHANTFEIKKLSQEGIRKKVIDRGFATRKHPRFYKSYAVTPEDQNNSLRYPQLPSNRFSVSKGPNSESNT